MRRPVLVLVFVAIGALGGWLVASTQTVCTSYGDGGPSLQSFCEVKVFGWWASEGSGVAVWVLFGAVVGLAAGALLARARSRA